MNPRYRWDAEECARRKKGDRALRRLTILFFVALAAILVGIELGRAVFIYGDWRCAFADCRITVVSPAP